MGPQELQGATGMQGPAGLQGPAGPQGPKGDTGVQGPQGKPGLDGRDGANGADGLDGVPQSKTDLYVRTVTKNVFPGTTSDVVASCDTPTDILISGSCEQTNTWEAVLFFSHPENVTDTTTPASWRCRVQNGSTVGATSPVTAYAVCIRTQ